MFAPGYNRGYSTAFVKCLAHRKPGARRDLQTIHVNVAGKWNWLLLPGPCVHYAGWETRDTYKRRGDALVCAERERRVRTYVRPSLADGFHARGRSTPRAARILLRLAIPFPTPHPRVRDGNSPRLERAIRAEIFAARRIVTLSHIAGFSSFATSNSCLRIPEMLIRSQGV